MQRLNLKKKLEENNNLGSINTLALIFNDIIYLSKKRLIRNIKNNIYIKIKRTYIIINNQNLFYYIKELYFYKI